MHFVNLSSTSRRGPQKLRARVRQVVSETILLAAEEVLAERGVHVASVSEIAARAGVAVGTVYNHFEDRTALVQALYRVRREQISPRIIEILRASEGQPFEARLRGYLREVAALFDQHRAFLKVVMEGDHRERAAVRSASPILARMLDGLTELMRAGVAERVAEIADPSLAAWVAAGALRAVILRGLAEGRPFAADIDGVADILLRGVLVR